jgi:hypothetical protein
MGVFLEVVGRPYGQLVLRASPWPPRPVIPAMAAVWASSKGAKVLRA